MLSAKSLDFNSKTTAINCWRVVEQDNLQGNSVVAVCPNQFWADYIVVILNDKESCGGETELYKVFRPGEVL